MRLTRAVTIGLAVFGLLAGAARAGAPSGSYTLRPPDDAELIDDPDFHACTVFISPNIVACFKGHLVEDVFGSVSASDGEAWVQYQHLGPPFYATFPVTLSGKMGGTFAHPQLKLPIRGSGTLQLGDDVGTGKGSVTLKCSRTPQAGLWGCRPTSMPFCVDVPGVGKGCGVHKKIAGAAIRVKVSAWTFSFELATDASNAVTGTATLDLDTGEHVDLVASGKYNPRSQSSSLRFVSTPVAGITFAITKLADTGPGSIPTGLLDYKLTGEAHGRIDFSKVLVFH
ncbi:MAG TPA: hypothetical protein VMR86_04445 [Myxococcota bacterium]|nr:hypothetical protein [Myxococcota bacterium]